ncbi:MAG TPA: hypothetical protein EYP55_01580, partial [Anaerolineae bacterium]|nr:hypothetical protein [Anaerolineae bacterium]
MGGVVAAQFSTPIPTPISTPAPTITPVPVLIVTPAVTPTPTATRVPGPQLPSDIEEALRFLKEVAQRYGWLGVAVVVLLYWLWK